MATADSCDLGECSVPEKRDYRDLVVWQRAINVIPTIYAMIAKFPRVEEFALSAQMRRSCVSIAANIAEGQARSSRKEFRQYLAIAKGSLAELHTLLVVAERLRYLGIEQLNEIERELTAVRKPLVGLMDQLQ